MRSRLVILVLLVSAAPTLLADGVGVDKVYHPYVQPLERELEYRSVWIESGDQPADGLQYHRLGFAKSLNDRWTAELYLIGSRQSGGSLSLEAYEAEAKWQLTEQGEFAVDWGMLFELEVNKDENIREYATTLLAEKEFGRWVGALNLAVVYEWGDDISNEWESTLAGQFRYRYSRSFEPALEVYSSDFFKGVGPVALGTVPFAGRRQLRWEAGVIFGADNDSPDQAFRLLLEYEF